MGGPGKTPQRRTKVLALGVSYASVERLLNPQAPRSGSGGSSSKALHKSNTTKDLSYSVDTAIECVERGLLTEMDGRDLSRCLATEKYCNADLYTVSQEKGALYDPSKHLEANFNRHTFCRELKKHFATADDVTYTDNDTDVTNVLQFDQVVLDYFWIPAGWNVQHWSRSFFQHTLVSLVKDQLLYMPPTPPRNKRTTDRQSGVVYLPFCLHCFKEIVACRETLTKYYKISFLRRKDLGQVALWKGTQQIEPRVMQGVFGKRIDQEELYCTFGPLDVSQAMEDPSVSKKMLVSLARRLENFPDIRMIKLEPIIMVEKATRFTRGSSLQNKKPVAKDPFRNFLGLSKPSLVKRGFDKARAAGQAPIVTPPRLVAVKAKPTNRFPTQRSPRKSQSAVVPAKAKKRKQLFKHNKVSKARKVSPVKATPTVASRVARSPAVSAISVSSPSASISYKLRSRSPRSVVSDVETPEMVQAARKRLFDE